MEGRTAVFASSVVSPRATIHDEPEGFEVVVPAPRNFVLIVFLCIWLAGWVAGETFALRALLSDRAMIGAQLFLAAWLTFWTLGGCGAMATIAFQIAGRERLMLASDELRLRQEVLGFGRWRRIPLDRVTGLGLIDTTVRVGMPVIPAVSRGLEIAGLGSGGLLICTEGRRRRFGTALSREEAQDILRELRRRHSFPEPGGASAAGGATHAA
jgi:hypothetical protein